jgi:hypothetical protein
MLGCASGRADRRAAERLALRCTRCAQSIPASDTSEVSLAGRATALGGCQNYRRRAACGPVKPHACAPAILHAIISKRPGTHRSPDRPGPWFLIAVPICKRALPRCLGGRRAPRSAFIAASPQLLRWGQTGQMFISPEPLPRHARHARLDAVTAIRVTEVRELAK